VKPIAATLGAGRRDFFWLDGSLGMMTSSPTRGLGFNQGLGGIFTSVPAVVATLATQEPRLVATSDAVLGMVAVPATVSGAGPAPAGHATPILHAEAAAVPAAGRAVAARHLVPGGVDAGGLRPAAPRVDVFGLGLDYGLYHKRRWGAPEGDERGPWQALGGVFTSSPAAILWSGTRLDVFGVGLDHAMYTRSCAREAWTPEWRSLGGAFTSAAALVARGPQLELFARGADFTLRGNHTDGTTWFGWQNHGGQLASAPVAVSWGPDRLDLFAVFRDGALWHRWWDGQLWNDWESLGGAYVGEPAAVSWAPGRLDVLAVGAADRALYHQAFDANTWSQPQRLNAGTQRGVAASPTVLSGGPNRLEALVPVEDGQIRIGTWEGQAWSFGAAGASWRAPSRFRISVDLVEAHTARALNADTDGAVASLTVGNVPVQTRTQWIGDIGGTHPKTAQTNLLAFEGVAIDLAEPMSLSYLVVNNGHVPSDKVLAALAGAGDSLGLAGSSSMQEDIGKGIAHFLTVRIVAATTVAVPVVGSVLGPLEAWLLGKLTDAMFQSCDGVVAAELRALTGRDLYLLTDNGRRKVTVVTTHAGTGAPSNCGNRSQYAVTWTIAPL
jgi:hypothetical protein